MNPRLSTYLDLLRLLAALVVVTEHAAFLLAPGMGLPTFGREAVVVFFVISGFVIGHVVSRKEANRIDYGFARLSRMYSVVPLALLVTVLSDAIGRHYAPGWYVAHQFQPYNSAWRFRDAARFLTFTNEVWRSHSVVGTNEPFWSLGFEVPYYILFGMVYFATTRSARALWSMLWAILFGPKIVAFLPLWLIGFATYRALQANVRMPAAGAPIAAVVTFGMALVVALGLDFAPGQTLFLWKGFAAAVPLILYTYLLAIILGLHLLAIGSLPDARTLFGDRLDGSVRWLAHGSFTLYVMHIPILCCLAAITGAASAGPTTGALVIAATLGLCYLFAEAGERRKRQAAAILARGRTLLRV